MLCISREKLDSIAKPRKTRQFGLTHSINSNYDTTDEVEE